MRAITVLLSLTLLSTIAAGQTTWTGLVSDNWDTAFNWDTGVVPGPLDNVVIAPGGVMPSTYVFGPVCNDLTVMAGTSLTLTAGFDLNVLGDVDIQGTLVVNNSSSLVSVAGDWTNDGAFSHGLGEVDLTGSGALEGTTPTLFNNLTISGGVRSALASFNVGGDVTIEAGAILDLAAAINAQVTGNWNSSATGAQTTGTGTIVFDGSGTVTSGLNGLPNLSQIGGTRKVNPSIVTGNLVMTSGTLEIQDNAGLKVDGDATLSGGTLSFSSLFAGSEILDIAGDATFTAAAGLFSSSVEIHCEGNWSSDSTFLPSAGTVVLNGPGTRTLSGAAPAFHHLRVSTGTVNLTSATSLSGTLLIDSGATLDADATTDIDGSVVLGDVTAQWDLGGLTHTVEDDWTSAGGGASNGTIEMDGPTRILAAGAPIDNLTIDATGLHATDSLAVSGTLTLLAGELRIDDGATLAVAVNAALTGGTLSFDDTSSAVDILNVSGNIDANGLTAGSFGASSIVRCGGNWNSGGTFAPTDGLILLNGGLPASVGGSPASFHNLQIAGGVKTLDVATSLSGDMDIDDGAGLITSGALTIAGSVQVGNATASWDMGTLTHNVAGSLTSTGADLTNGTISLDGASGTIDTSSGTVANLQILSGVRAIGDVNVTGDFSATGGILSTGAGTLVDIGGDASVAGATAGTVAADASIEYGGNWVGSASWAPLAGSVTHDGVSAATITGVSNFFGLTIASGAVTAADPVSIGGDFTLNGALTSGSTTTVAGLVALGTTATWDLGGNTHTVSGDWTSTGGSATGGTVEFIDDGSLATDGGTIDHVTVSSGARVVAASVATGSLSMTGGSITIADDDPGQVCLEVQGDVAFTGGSLLFTDSTSEAETMTVLGNATLNVPVTLEGSDSHVFCGGNWDSDGSFAPSSVTVHLDGSLATAVTGTPNFHHLRLTTATRTFSGPTAVSGDVDVSAGATLDADAVLDIEGAVSLDASATFDVGALVHTVAGDWTSSGGDAVGLGTIRFDGDGTTDTGAASFSNVDVSAGTRLMNTSNVTTALSMGGGTLDIQDGQTLSVGGDATLSAGTLTFTAGPGDALEVLDVAGSVTMTATAGSMSSDSMISCAGDWVTDSTWVPSAGLVSLDGGGTTTISGTTINFHHLTVLAGDKTNSDPMALGGDLLIAGGQSLTSLGSLTVLGNVALQPTASWSTGALTHQINGDWLSNGASVSGSATLEFVDVGSMSTGASTVPNVLVSAGDRAVSTSAVGFDLDMTGGSITVQDNATLTVQGDATLTAGTLGFVDLTAGDETLAVQGNVLLTATSGATSTDTLLLVNGDWTSTSAWTPAAGRVRIASTSSTIGGTSPTFANLELNSGTINFLVSGVVTSDLTLSSGVVFSTQDSLDIGGSVALGNATAAWDVGASTHTVSGDWSSAGASATGSGAIEFDGSGSLETNGGTLPDVLISGGNREVTSGTITGGLVMDNGAIQMLDDSLLSIAGDMSLNAGSLSFSSANPGQEVIDVDGDVTIGAATSGGSTATAEIRCAGNWSSGSGYDQTSGRIVLDGAFATTLGGSGLVLPNLEVSAGDKTLLTSADLQSVSLASGASLTTSGSMNISGAVLLGDATASLDMGGLGHVVDGDWVSGGADAVNGIVLFDGNGNFSTGSASIANVTVQSGVRTTQTAVVAGDLILSAGELNIDEDSTLSVGGNASLTGGTLSWFDAVVAAPEEILDVEGHVTCLSAVSTASSDSIFRCGGDWSSNSSFAMPAGAVELDGLSATSITGVLPSADPTFSNLKIRNGARTVNGPLTLVCPAVTIEPGGGLEITGTQVDYDAGLLSVDGDLDLGAGGTLALGSAAIALVSPTGSLTAQGDLLSPARITGLSGGGYLLSIEGTLDAVNFEFSQMGPGGVEVSPSATVVDLRAGLFTQPSATAGSILLDIRRPTPSAFYYVDFEDPSVVGTTNVRCLGGQQISFRDSEGAFSGATFESDPLGLVEWISDPTTLSSFEATASADLVTVSWTSANEANSQSWILQRALSAGGPFSDIFVIAAAGPSLYGYVDAAVVSKQTYHYKLIEEKTHGEQVETASASATPWTTGLPPNVLSVGASGAHPTIQDALNAISFANPVISIEGGTYAPFTVNGGFNGTIRIFADGSGPVIIDTSTGPVTAQNLSPFDSIEMSDLIIGDPASGNPGVLVTNCLGPVILDELEVHGGSASDAGIHSTGSTKVAVQRCDVDGGPGILAESGTVMIIGNGTLDEIEVQGSSNVRMAGLSAAQTVDPSSILSNLPGVHADLDCPEFVTLGGSISMTLDGEPGGLYGLAYSGSLAWFDLLPPWQMVGLINLFSAPVISTGVLFAPPQPLVLPMPADGKLFGTAIPLQMVVVTPAGFRWSNVTSIVPTN